MKKLLISSVAGLAVMASGLATAPQSMAANTAEGANNAPQVAMMTSTAKTMSSERKTRVSSSAKVVKKATPPVVKKATPAPAPRKGSWLLKKYGNKIYFNGKTELKTCSQLISLWAPSQLPQKNGLGEKFKVSCVNKKQMDKLAGDGVLGYTTTFIQVDDDNHIQALDGSLEIVLLSDLSMGEMIEVYNHEAWHAYQGGWSIKKQKDYLKTLGVKYWNNGEDYLNLPTERWAWASTACYERFNEEMKGFEYLIPGGCSTNKKFSKVW